MSNMNTMIIGVYKDEENLLSSIRKLKQKGFKIREVFSPFPIFEVFEELDMKTRFPFLAFFFGIIGVTTTYLGLYWTSVIDYPLNFGGKPQNSLSFIIIMFVMTINITSALTVLTFFFRQKIWPGKKVAPIDIRITDDKFIVVIDKSPNFSVEDVYSINSVLTETGAVEIRESSEKLDC